MKKILSLFTIIFLGGCMSTSNVVPLGNGTYHLTAKDQGGIFSNDGKVISTVMNQAQIFCSKQNKKVETITLNRDPEGPMRFETSDLIFRCK